MSKRMSNAPKEWNELVECAPDIDESLKDHKNLVKFAAGWEIFKKCEALLLDFGVDLREPYTFLDSDDLLKTGFYPWTKLRIYDGAALAENDTFAAIFPKVKLIKNNRDEFLKYRYLSLEHYDMFNCQDVWDGNVKHWLNPEKIFIMCMIGVYESDQFHILYDDHLKTFDGEVEAYLYRNVDS